MTTMIRRRSFTDAPRSHLVAPRESTTMADEGRAIWGPYRMASSWHGKPRRSALSNWIGRVLALAMLCMLIAGVAVSR